MKQEYLLPQYAIIIIKENRYTLTLFARRNGFSCKMQNCLRSLRNRNRSCACRYSLRTRSCLSFNGGVFDVEKHFERKARFPLHNDKIRLPKGDCFVQTATNAKLCNGKPQSKSLKPFAELCLFTHKKLFVF